MKRTILTFVILASLSTTSIVPASASLQRKGEGRNFPKEMKLTDDQKKKLSEIDKDFDQKVEAVKNSRITEEVQRERILKLKDEKKEASLKILTPEQQELMAKKMPRQRSGKASHRSDTRQHRVGKGGDRSDVRGGIEKDLDLTDAQKEQVKELRSKYGEENRATAEKYREEFDKILTPEQQAKVKEQRESAKEKRESRRGDMEKIGKLSDADKTTLKDLKDEYEKQKNAVERSRIAPEMQKQKLQILKENYEKNKKELLDSVK